MNQRLTYGNTATTSATIDMTTAQPAHRADFCAASAEISAARTARSSSCSALSFPLMASPSNAVSQVDRGILA